MKIQNLVFLTLILLSNVVFGEDLIPHWADDSKKVVTFVADAHLEVNVTVLDVDAQHYSQMDVRLEYAEIPKSQSEALQGAYPGYLFSNAIMTKKEDYTLRIPALKINQKVDTLNSPEGPTFSYTTYLNRADTNSIIDELNAGRNPVNVTGTLSASVPVYTVIDQLSLPPETCDRLVAGTSTLFDFINRFAAVSKQIDRMTTSFDSTRTALKKKILTECVEFESKAQVDSFRSLLNERLRSTKITSTLVGTTSQFTPHSVDLTVKYYFTKNVRR